MVQKRKNTVEKYEDKAQKQREKVLKKYSKVSDCDIDEICTYLQVKIEGSKLWIGSSLTLLVALFINQHDHILRMVTYHLISLGNKKINYDLWSNSRVMNGANEITIAIEIIIFAIFLRQAWNIYILQRDLIWLSKKKKK